MAMASKGVIVREVHELEAIEINVESYTNRYIQALKRIALKMLTLKQKAGFFKSFNKGIDGLWGSIKRMIVATDKEIEIANRYLAQGDGAGFIKHRRIVLRKISVIEASLRTLYFNVMGMFGRGQGIPGKKTFAEIVEEEILRMESIEKKKAIEEERL